MRIKKYLLGAAIIANSVALTAAFVVTPASAAPQNEASTIEFGALEDASYSEVFDAIRASNDSEVAAEFFAVASEKPSAVDLPGLEELSTAEKSEVLEASAEAAARDKSLPLNDLPSEIAPDGATSSALSIVAASVAQNRPTITTAFARTGGKSPSVKLASFASAPVAGGAINNSRSWQMSNRYNWSECSIFSCTVTSWLDFRFTTDPGKSSSRTSVNFTKWGSKIGSVQVNSWVFAAGNNYGASGWQTWNTPGYGTQYNYHNSTLSKSFQAWYEVRIGRPGGTQAFEFKTGKSATCKEPSPAAYQCVF